MRKKRSDGVWKWIGTSPTRTHIILSLSIWQFRENILNILPSARCDETRGVNTATIAVGAWDETRR